MKRTLLTLGGALLLLAALFLILDWRQRAAARPHYAFDTAGVADVVRLSVAYQQDSVALIRSGSLWLDAADSFPVDSSRMSTVLDRLLKVENRERVSVSEDTVRLAEYGLSPGAAKRVEWTLADGRRFAILVGKTSGTDYSSTYWKFAAKSGGEPGVYRTPGNFTYDIAVRAVDWRQRPLFPAFIYEDVRSVEVDWLDSAKVRVHYKLERIGDSVVVMTEPRRADIPPLNARKVLEQTPQLIADEFVDTSDAFLPLAGLDDGVVVIRTVMNSGAVRTFSAGNEFGGMYYARHPALRSAIIKIAKWRLEFFRKTPEELLIPPPPDSPNTIPGDSAAAPGAGGGR